jgi:Rod binding domain-containing protein
MTAGSYRFFTSRAVLRWKSRQLEGTRVLINSATQQTAPPAPVRGPADETALRKVALDLEASFLAEMLKHAGLGQQRSAFGGGAGEEQFSSFLVQAQADQLVKSGGIGLAESIFEALKERGNGA